MTDSTNNYRLKKIHFLGRETPIICQSENGPCPLLAISNVLLLRGHIRIHPDYSVITSDELIQIIANRLIESNPPLENSEFAEHQEKTLNDVISLLPHLLVGLDVNVRFNSISDFEYTPECATFDMLDISLVHGWLVDGQDTETKSAIRQKSYNQLVEEVIDYQTSEAIEVTNPDDTHAENSTMGEASIQNDSSEKRNQEIDAVAASLDDLSIKVQSNSDVEGSPIPNSKRSPSRASVEAMKKERQMSERSAFEKVSKLLEEGPVIRAFLESTSHQLTYHGLLKLHEGIKERQLCVFFRNNHFSTIFKYQGELFLLVTDTGYSSEKQVVWEILNEIDGDTTYYNGSFKPLDGSSVADEAEANAQRSSPHSRAITGNTNRQELEPDYLLALKLQEEENAGQNLSSVQSNPASIPINQPQPHQSENRNLDSSDSLRVSSTGELLATPEEIQAQLQQEQFFKERMQQQQQQQRQEQQRHQLANPPFQPRQERTRRRNDSDSGCVVQ